MCKAAVLLIKFHVDSSNAAMSLYRIIEGLLILKDIPYMLDLFDKHWVCMHVCTHCVHVPTIDLNCLQWSSGSCDVMFM